MSPVFDALGNATRRRILDLIKSAPGCTVGELASHFDTTRIAVMHHLRQLEECDLVMSRKVGRTRRLYHNPVPIQLIYDRWTTEYSSFWASRMADVKYAVEHDQPRSERHGGHGAAGVEDPHPGSNRGRVA
ncbi:MAG: helix-turn-helix transcriptional regulator [Gemmatimonadetes bacterium]|nr:helix-turn-helix transcriptional regulator [Gemmatimonadota bacterium]